MIVFKTSIGPANVLDLSWSLKIEEIMKKISQSTLITKDALDLYELEWNDHERFCGSLKQNKKKTFRGGVRC